MMVFVNWRRRIRIVSANPAIAALVVALVAAPVRAESARDLLDQVAALAHGPRKWTDRTQKLRLRIVDRRGAERRRELEVYMKKFSDDANRSIVFFQSPPEIKGTGFLQWGNPHGQDEQWLYLPELKRVRQITGGSKRESFVGTDFSYEDLAVVSQIIDWTEDDARATLQRKEAVDGAEAAVIEFTPTGKDVAYEQIRVWLRLSDLVIVKYEFVGSKGTVAKVLTVGDIRVVGAIPTAFHQEMKNVRSGSYTVVDYSEVKYDTGLADDVFSKRTLERGGL